MVNLYRDPKGEKIFKSIAPQSEVGTTERRISRAIPMPDMSQLNERVCKIASYIPTPLTSQCVFSLPFICYIAI